MKNYLIALAGSVLLYAAIDYRSKAIAWREAYEAQVEIHNTLEELVKEFRTACAER